MIKRRVRSSSIVSNASEPGAEQNPTLVLDVVRRCRSRIGISSSRSLRFNPSRLSFVLKAGIFSVMVLFLVLGVRGAGRCWKECRSVGESTAALKCFISPQQCSFVHSRYKLIRANLDLAYHDVYSAERIELQDNIIDSVLQQSEASNSCSNMKNNHSSAVFNASSHRHQQQQQWIVFTAGAMGSGKSHTIRVLHERSLFPLDAFVIVDPDRLRYQLPEFSTYIQLHPEQAGEWTRKEAGLMAEILVEAALQAKRNVLVDGSLRDATWYQRYFSKLRKGYPRLYLAILHVVAPKEIVLERAESRAKITGRVVPKELLESSVEQVPRSVARLAAHVDFVAEVFNGGGDQQQHHDTNTSFPKLLDMNWTTFQNQWAMICGARSPSG